MLSLCRGSLAMAALSCDKSRSQFMVLKRGVVKVGKLSQCDAVERS